jgi:hypothetical protein
MNDDKIAEALDLTPLIPQKKELKMISSDDDYQMAKGNMENVLDVGTNALSELASMANLSQDPRVYRVLTELISAMTTANKELMDIKLKQVNIEQKQKKEQTPQTVNQNLFVGSTADLVKILEKTKNENT